MRLKTIIPLSLILFLAAGCSGLLPVARTKAISRWENFDQVKASYDLITPLETKRTDLMELGFNPYQASNILIHNYLTIIDKFMPTDNITLADIPPRVRECVEAKDSCIAYELKLETQESYRYGNVFLDLLNFKRQTHQIGWRFTAFIVLVNDLVVYKLWDGQPSFEGDTYTKNPLGPLQEPSNLITGAAMADSM
jgi:hypothetical protein